VRADSLITGREADAYYDAPTVVMCVAGSQITRAECPTTV